MSEDSVVVTLVNQESPTEDLDLTELKGKGITGLYQDEAESTSEGDIEIENLVEDETEAHGNGENSEGGGSGSGHDGMTNITFDVRKRTLIMLWQRSILEDYYRAGMTSASMQLHTMHQAAAEKTGLDHSVVKNWIRNRRRPAAIKSAEKLAEKMSHGEVSAPFPHTSLTSLVSSIHSPSLPPTTTTHTQPSLPAAGRTLPPQMQPQQQQQQQQPPNISQTPNGLLSQLGSPASDPKRIRLDHGSTSPHLTLATLQPPSHPSPLLVKIRVSDSGEVDFYEIELPAITYDSLLKACAEELEVGLSQIAKIRKLPNILIRKDRDVQRLKEGQELEVVLKDSLSLNVASGFGQPGLPMLNSLSADSAPQTLGGNENMGLHPITTSPQLNSAYHTNR